MRRRWTLPGAAVLVSTAVVITMAATVSTLSFGSTNTALQGSPKRTTYEISAGGRNRSWLDIAPQNPVGATPLVVVLAGSAATHAQEIQRDGLLPLAKDGLAELVYPAGIGESWNAGGCCGTAAKQ